MWYTVLYSTHFPTQKAGSIYNVTVGMHGMVVFYRVNSDGARLGINADFVLFREEARKYFSQPTKSFTDAMEQSFMVCEAAYC